MKLSLLLESTRPKLFTASIAPVLVGTAVAYADGTVAWNLAPLVLMCAMLIQLLSNWVNDLYDYQRGADTHRVGPRRLLAQGMVSYSFLRNAAWCVAIVCFALGIPIIVHGGLPILIIGGVCLTAAWAYTGGPFPLAYHGLGDVAAFLLFGVVAIGGTYFVHTGRVTSEVLITAVGPGLLVANILAVNNIRDINTDAKANKRTLAVGIGLHAARHLYALAMAVAFVVPVILFMQRGTAMLLPLLVVPAAVTQCRTVYTKQGEALNKALAGTAVVYLCYALLLSTAFVLSTL